jgi:DNA-binding LytR/AlgR family response regulator
MKDYLKIHTIKGDFLTLMNFAQLEELINNQKFFRVHKSFMVAIDKIEHVEKNRIKIGQHLVPISEKYNESFFNSLKGLK